jgi:hypothetical protein
MQETGQAFSVQVRLAPMTVKTAQLTIIYHIFSRQAGSRRSSTSSQADSQHRMPPAGVARQAWRLLRQQGLIDSRGRLTLSGLAVAVALRARARQSSNKAARSKPAALCDAASGLRRLSLAA